MGYAQHKTSHFARTSRACLRLLQDFFGLLAFAEAPAVDGFGAAALGAGFSAYEPPGTFEVFGFVTDDAVAGAGAEPPAATAFQTFGPGTG